MSTLCLDIYVYTYSSMHVTTINAKGHEFEIEKGVLREGLKSEKEKWYNYIMSKKRFKNKNLEALSVIFLLRICHFHTL